MYSRTQNENGSYNTRCLDCFMTIASSVETDKELTWREAHHTCLEKELACPCAREKPRIAFSGSRGIHAPE